VIERALIDYYRCPGELVKMTLAGDLSSDSGYFRFGPNICYGQSAGGVRGRLPLKALHDTLPLVSVENEVLRVPFDPSQVVDNFRFERYATADPSDSAHEMFWQRPYYSLRRFIPASVRQQLQRAYFRNWKRLSFPRWPVDRSVDQILERLLLLVLQRQGVGRVPFIWFWPEGASSCAIFTHDVETAAGRDRCSWLMDVDDACGVKASFQVVPEDRYTISAQLLDEMRRRGFEINVHDLNHDGRLFSSREEFLRRAERINGYLRDFKARGFRSGALYRRPDWLAALDIAYDTSIPNTGHLEVQRGGCCTVMPYFIGQIVELPVTTTQDYSLFHILKDFSNDVWKAQIDSIIAGHGLLHFIVHPDYLDAEQAHRAYCVLLDRVSRLREAGQSWVTLPGEVERWWRQRSRMTLVRHGDRWAIEGAGKERARIAYAELDGDRLLYTVEPATETHSEPARA
jgi:hypothetical protein